MSTFDVYAILFCLRSGDLILVRTYPIKPLNPFGPVEYPLPTTNLHHVRNSTRVAG
jgi:hypothetical protein